MAAATHLQVPRLAELRQINGDDLAPLLEEEAGVWKTTLDWDFSASAALIRRFVDMQALSGFALVIAGRVAGYAYYVCEERKGLIGDLYVLRQFATPDNESRLLTAVVDALMKTPLVKRIESQLMMLRNLNRAPVPHWRYLRAYERQFMEVSTAEVGELPPAPARSRIRIEPWKESRQDEAAVLIAHAYLGHVDSQINDQYRSPAGARRFLMNIVQYPGCGSFFQPASCLALDASGKLCGLCLTSLVSSEVGHITQICVSPAVRGKGAGYELLRNSLRGLRSHGCRKASLTVTASNQEAIQLYARVGFQHLRNFVAYVWEGF